MEALNVKMDSVLDIRAKELPSYDIRLSFTQWRVNKTNRYITKDIRERKDMVIKKACWAAIIANKIEMRRQKLRCYRVVEILRNYTLYHMMRRWRRQASFETALREKSKIDGAYILIKRFKNRLKALDKAVERLHTVKANQVEVSELRAATSQERAQSVMDDMKLLFDTTTKEFEKKLQAKIGEVEKTYDRIIE